MYLFDPEGFGHIVVASQAHCKIRWIVRSGLIHGDLSSPNAVQPGPGTGLG